MKLFTIGDSISQGFMSLAAARTELVHSTLIARALGLTPGTDDYSIPLWGAGVIPLNIESLLRSLQRRYGSDIRGPLEWPLAVATVNGFLDDVEDPLRAGCREHRVAPGGAPDVLPERLGRGLHRRRRLDGDPSPLPRAHRAGLGRG
jgi:hypothetical protein